MAKQNEENDGQKSGGGLKKILILVGVFVMLVGGAFAFVKVAVPPAAAEEDKEAVKDEDREESWKEETFQLEVLFVNVAETNGKRYLKVGLNVRFRAEKPSEQIARFTKEDTLIKDHLITLLSGKTLKDIDGAENKRLMKQEIREVLQKALFSDPDQHGTIEQVLYYEFLVQ